MKKIIIFAGILLLAAGCQKQAQKNQENNTQPQERASSTEQNNLNLPQGNKAEWETYTNADYGFTVQYPKSEFIVYSDYNKVKTLSYVPACDKTMAGCLFYSKINQESTNFEGAGVSVNVLKYLTTKAKCETMEGAQGVKAEINGETFSRFGNSGAAAGHFEEFQSNRIFKNNTCYEVTLRMTSANIANYPEGTVKEFNSKEVWEMMERVANTFKFTTQLDTSNWKIYNSAIVGFTLKYPARWTVTDFEYLSGTKGKKFISTDGLVSFTISDGSEVNYNDDGEYTNITLPNGMQAKNKEDWVKYGGVNFLQNRWVIIAKNNKLYLIYINYRYDYAKVTSTDFLAQSASDKDSIEGVLSTLQFAK